MVDLTPPRFARQPQREHLMRFEALATTSRSLSGEAWGREGLHDRACSRHSATAQGPEVPVRCGAEPCAPAGAADGEARQ
jgi:hypothetical protein